MKSTKASTLTSEILVVEDSPTQQEQVRHLLEGHGFSVRAVCNGKEALEHMRKHQPALVISDVVMPEMDGYALCGEMKSHASLKDIPVILLTSLSGPEDIIKGLQCGADNFIKKPFDERYLLSRVEYILVNRRLRKSDKLQMGVELYLGGQKHFITAERQQILDLLISTYDQAVRLNEELQSREKEIDRANLILRGLYQIAKRLNQAATEQELVEQVLDRALELPGFKAGWIALAEGEACFPVAAVRGVPLDHKETGVLDGMCLCRRKLLSGELQRTTIIPDCERLAKMDGDALGQRLHVSIPLLINDRAIGIMNLVVSGQLTFGDDDIQTFNGIGNQIGVALERVRMREHLEQLVQERTAALTAEIAERKRAEEQLRLLAHTIRSVSDCITVTDTEERLIFVNDAFLKTYGYTEAEVLGRDIGLVRSPNNDPALTATIHPGTLAGGWQGELLNRRKDGTEFTVHLISSVVRDERGEVVAMVGVARDISEQRRAKDALQRERSLLRTLIDNLPDAIYVKDSACRTTIANVADVRWMGRQSEAEVLQKSDFDFYPADIAAAYYAADQSVIQTGTPVLNKEESLLDKEGKTHFFSTSKLPLRDERGQIIGLVGVGREVTEQKRAEDALRHEKALMDALMDNIPDSIYFKDRQCRLVRINRKMMQSLNLDEMSQAIAKTDVELYGEEFGRKTLAIDQQLMESGEPIIGLVETRQLQDGQINWTSTTKVPLRDNGGQVVGLVGITREINELMRAQEEREHERSLLRTLIDNLPDYIYVKDTEGRFVVANRAVVRQLGFASEGELVGKSDFDLFPRELAARYYVDEQTIIQSGQGLYNHEGPTVDANKEEKNRWVLTTKAPLRDGQGKITGFVGIGRDITERKELETRAQDTLSALEASRESLAQLNAQKDRLLSVLSHDLRSPFTSILGFCEILLTDGETTTDAERKEFLTYIRDAAQRQLALLNKLLDWSRLQTGRIKLDIQEINLENIVTNCVENHLGTSKQKEITLKSTLPRDMKVRGDRELLMQAFNNLISNALKFTPANGVISVDVIEDKEEEWVVAVKDTGRGIPKEDIGKLFKAEEKYTRPGLDGEQGTGLGLSLVYEIVKQHNGSVSVESEVGLGTTFIIRLPRIVENKERVVMVVDDDEGVRVLHSRYIKRMYPDAQVIQASNGKEAFELAKRSRPYLIVTDYSMPEMNGYEFLSLLKGEPATKHIPVFVITGKGSPASVDTLLSSGAVAVLEKPVSAKKLQETIEKILAQRI